MKFALRVARAAIPAGLLLSITLPAFAQSTATLRGTVVDPLHMPIAGAVVTVTAPGSAAKPLHTDAEGRFSVAIAPGSYRISIRSPGFAESSAQITVEAGDVPPPHQFILTVAALQQAVTVRGATPYQVPAITSATRTLTALRDVPQSVTVVTRPLIQDQLMTSIADVVRYVPGMTSHQGENNRDQVIIRGNSSSADFFVNGVRDDVQYFRDLYNLERLEVLKGPNGLMFGRGGAGGVVNRVLKEAGFSPVREVTLQAGQFGHKRVAADLSQPLGTTVAVRLNAMAEDSGSFRDGVALQRGAFNPTMTIRLSEETHIVAGYEYLRDRRTADRGITSFAGRPASVAPATFYGNARDSHVRADVNIGSLAIEHRAGRVTLRSRTLLGDFDRGYQNYVPGAASADASTVVLTAYNNATRRTNIFTQADLTATATTGPVRHTLLAGAEIGQQNTDNFRNTGFFNNSSTSIPVPFASPLTSVPVTFRQAPTDADNHVRTLVGAAFVQDQAELTRHLQLLGGVRVDRFDLRYHNNRNGDTLQRPDTLVSPRAAVIVKPVVPLSLYGSYSVSYLPSAGDQFSSLTTVTQQLQPEKFTNYEVGAKWDIAPTLAVTGAVYRLDRTNTRSTDPNDPTRIVQTGRQQTDGVEVGATGQMMPAWTIVGGYAFQDAAVTSATASAPLGAIVGQVPRHTFSWWNQYRIHPRLAAGLGVTQRSAMFAAIDDRVLLPGYVRVDAAGYLTFARQLRLQVNVENLTGRAYIVNADSNTNLSPGSPRSARVALVTTF